MKSIKVLEKKKEVYNCVYINRYFLFIEVVAYALLYFLTAILLTGNGIIGYGVTFFMERIMRTHTRTQTTTKEKK